MKPRDKLLTWFFWRGFSDKLSWVILIYILCQILESCPKYPLYVWKYIFQDFSGSKTTEDQKIKHSSKKITLDNLFVSLFPKNWSLNPKIRLLKNWLFKYMLFNFWLIFNKKSKCTSQKSNHWKCIQYKITNHWKYSWFKKPSLPRTLG